MSLPRLVLPAWCVVLALASAPRAQAAEPRTVKIEPSKLQVGIAGGTMTLNGTKLSLPVQRKELIRALGEPSREVRLANILLTWDELGIHAYQVPDTDKVRAISVDLDFKDYKFWPKKPFSGTLKVEGAVVTAESAIEDINRAMKKHTFKKSSVTDDSWKVEYDKCVLYLTEADRQAKNKKAKYSALQLDIKETK